MRRSRAVTVRRQEQTLALLSSSIDSNIPSCLTQARELLRPHNWGQISMARGFPAFHDLSPSSHMFSFGGSSLRAHLSFIRINAEKSWEQSPLSVLNAYHESKNSYRGNSLLLMLMGHLSLSEPCSLTDIDLPLSSMYGNRPLPCLCPHSSPLHPYAVFISRPIQKRIEAASRTRAGTT